MNRRGIRIPEDLAPTAAAPTVVPTEAQLRPLINEHREAFKKIKSARVSVLPEGAKYDPNKPFTVDEMVARLELEKRARKKSGLLEQNIEPALKIANDPQKMQLLPEVRRNELLQLKTNWEQALERFNPTAAAEKAATLEIDDQVTQRLAQGEDPEVIAADLGKRLKSLAREFTRGRKMPEEDPGYVQSGEFTGMRILKEEETLTGEKKGAELIDRIYNALVNLIGEDRADQIRRAAYGAPALLLIHPKLRETAQQLFGSDQEAA
jgi:hypothetical protein